MTATSAQNFIEDSVPAADLDTSVTDRFLRLRAREEFSHTSPDDDALSDPGRDSG